MHLPHIVKQVADTDHIRLMLKLIFESSHGIPSGIRRLSPYEWEAGTPPSGDARNARQPDINSIPQFAECVKFF